MQKFFITILVLINFVNSQIDIYDYEVTAPTPLFLSLKNNSFATKLKVINSKASIIEKSLNKTLCLATSSLYINSTKLVSYTNQIQNSTINKSIALAHNSFFINSSFSNKINCTCEMRSNASIKNNFFYLKYIICFLVIFFSLN